MADDAYTPENRFILEVRRRGKSHQGNPVLAHRVRSCSDDALDPHRRYPVKIVVYRNLFRRYELAQFVRQNTICEQTTCELSRTLECEERHTKYDILSRKLYTAEDSGALDVNAIDFNVCEWICVLNIWLNITGLNGERL